MDKILINDEKGVWTLAIRTNEANQFDAESFEEFDRKLGELSAKPGVRALIVRSGTAGVFSQGLNLTRLQAMTDAAAIDRFLELFYAILHKLYFFPAPVVAEIGGHAMGYGAMLALASDYRLMVDSGARIGLPEIKIGIRVPLFVCKLLENTIGHERAFKHVMDGTPWKSVTANEIGLIDELHPADKLEMAARKLADRLAAASASASRSIKKAMRATMQAEAAGLLATDIAETRASILTPDAREGIDAAVAGRRPRFPA
jgi:enoyl-CoA hydratase/carnithine racemase